MPKLIVTNKVVGEMTIPVLKDKVLKAGYIFTVDDEIFNNGDLQAALKFGYLREEIVHEKDPVSNIAKYQAKKAAEKASLKPKEEVKRQDPTADLIIDVTEMSSNDQSAIINEPKTKMASWDIENQKMVGKDESAELVRKQYNGVEQELQTGEVDFTDKEEKTEEKVVDLSDALKKKKRGRPSLKSSVEKIDKASKKLVAEAKTEEVIPTKNNDISFVDFEQEAEKIKNHPLLSKKPVEE